MCDLICDCVCVWSCDKSWVREFNAPPDTI